MSKVIAAVRNDEELAKTLSTDVEKIFVLSTNISQIKDEIEAVHMANKKIFVHIDLAEGIGKDEWGIKYLKELGVDGIISTRTSLIKSARKEGLFTVQRFFIVDSHSIMTTVESVKSSKADMIEIMPGTLPKVIKRLKGELGVSLVAGGLIETREEILSAIEAGAEAVSVGKKELWSVEI